MRQDSQISTNSKTSPAPLPLPSLHLPAQPCRLFRSNIEQLREARTLVQNVRTCLDSYRSRMLLLQRPYNIITSAQQSHVKDHPMSWPQYRNGCAVPSNHLCTAPVSTINLFSPKHQRVQLPVHHPLATVPTSSVKIVPTMMMIVEPRMLSPISSYAQFLTLIVSQIDSCYILNKPWNSTFGFSKIIVLVKLFTLWLMGHQKFTAAKNFWDFPIEDAEQTVNKHPMQLKFQLHETQWNVLCR